MGKWQNSSAVCNTSTAWIICVNNDSKFIIDYSIVWSQMVKRLVPTDNRQADAIYNFFNSQLNHATQQQQQQRQQPQQQKKASVAWVSNFNARTKTFSMRMHMPCVGIFRGISCVQPFDTISWDFDWFEIGHIENRLFQIEVIFGGKSAISIAQCSILHIISYRQKEPQRGERRENEITVRNCNPCDDSFLFVVWLKFNAHSHDSYSFMWTSLWTDDTCTFSSLLCSGLLLLSLHFVQAVHVLWISSKSKCQLKLVYNNADQSSATKSSTLDVLLFSSLHSNLFLLFSFNSLSYSSHLNALFSTFFVLSVVTTASLLPPTLNSRTFELEKERRELKKERINK